MKTENTHLSPDLSTVTAWPYSKRIYINRILWILLWATLWKICWKRFYPLRCILLNLVGAEISLKSQFSRTSWVEIPSLLKVGERVAIGDRVNLYNLGGLEIGDHTVISQDAYICGGTHDYTDPAYPLIRKKITIGSGVWIAAGAFIGPGVAIGDGAIIGARSVVLKDVKPWTVVAGNPAKEIKARVVKQ